MVEAPVWVDRVAQVIGIDQDEVLRKGVRHMVSLTLHEARVQYLVLKHKYNVESWAEMDELYRKGELEEEGTWRDYFRLMHLEERIGKLEALLTEISVE